jgi:hypothetical protein
LSVGQSVTCNVTGAGEAAPIGTYRPSIELGGVTRNVVAE